MEIRDWVSLISGIVSTLVVAVLVPLVKSGVALASRVALLEDRLLADRDNDSKTAAEIHHVRNELVRMGNQMAKSEGASEAMTKATAAMGQMLGDRLNSLGATVAGMSKDL